MLIFLLGFMGSGKSHCGKKIATDFSCSFVDLDHEIENREQLTIGEIFSSKGESAFRLMEAEVLRQIVKHLDMSPEKVIAVIACGGGTPCFHDNMEFMNQHGLTVWLNPSIKILVERLKKGKDHRPLISSMSEHELENFIEQKFEERKFFYGQSALIHDSDDCPLSMIKNHIKHV